MTLDWPFILLFASPAIGMGFLSVKGYTQKHSLYLWLALGAYCVGYNLFNVPSHPFFHLFLIGLFWGVLNSAVQSSFYTIYMENNPKAENSYSRLPRAFNRKVAMVLIGISTGIGFGTALGVVSWVAKKLIWESF